jgi:hypothetical protein
MTLTTRWDHQNDILYYSACPLGYREVGERSEPANGLQALHLNYKIGAGV